MGAVCGRPRYPRGVYLRPPPRIKGSKWCEQKEFMSNAVCIADVSFSIPLCISEEKDRIDWFDVVQDAFLNLCKESQRTITGSWADAILICASAMAQIGAPKLVTQPFPPGGSSSSTLMLDPVVVEQLGLPRSILKIHSAEEIMLMELLSKHPVVTSLRCTDGRAVSLNPIAAALNLNQHPLYQGDYDFDCIPRCGVLVGYDQVFWTVFDPRFLVFYKVRRAGFSGVGEFVLVPMGGNPQ